jgi:hypothetical protein
MVYTEAKSLATFGFNPNERITSIDNFQNNWKVMPFMLLRIYPFQIDIPIILKMEEFILIRIIKQSFLLMNKKEVVLPKAGQ